MMRNAELEIKTIADLAHEWTQDIEDEKIWFLWNSATNRVNELAGTIDGKPEDVASSVIAGLSVGVQYLASSFAALDTGGNVKHEFLRKADQMGALAFYNQGIQMMVMADQPLLD